MVRNDIRFGLRMLRRDPAFTAVAVVTLALGIGANTAIFTLVNAILLQSLPVREPARLVLFGDQISSGTYTGNAPGGAWRLFSSEAVDFMQRQALPFEGIAVVSSSGDDPVSVRLPGGARAERAQAHLVSGAYFTVMGVTAAYGRTLSADDDRSAATPAAVVSYPFWAARLQSHPSAVGAVAILNGTPFTIVGVAPREFFGERVRQPPDFWVPLIFQPQIQLRPPYRERTGAYWLDLIGRLAPGATRDQAQGAATAALHRFLTAKESAALTDERRRDIQESRIDLKDGAAGISGLRLRYSEPLRVLLAVVALVLLLACANVGNLLLSRAAARQTEITVRMALGVGRGRLIRQLLTESVLLAVLGAAGGLLLARWMVGALLSLIVSRGSPVQGTLDVTVLAFTVGVTGLAAILFGLAPAISAGRVDLVTALKSRGRSTMPGLGGSGFTRGLVVAQIAISLVLLVGANLFARSLINLETQPLGFDRDHVLLTRINPRLAGYTPESVNNLYRKLFDRVSAVPGLRGATIARYSPLGGSRSSNSAVVEGYVPKNNESVRLETIQVGPEYPAALGMTLTQGRVIDIQDSVGSPKVGMVNKAFVRRVLSESEPAGPPIRREWVARLSRRGDRWRARGCAVSGFQGRSRAHGLRGVVPGAEPVRAGCRGRGSHGRRSLGCGQRRASGDCRGGSQSAHQRSEAAAPAGGRQLRQPATGRQARRLLRRARAPARVRRPLRSHHPKRGPPHERDRRAHGARRAAARRRVDDSERRAGTARPRARRRRSGRACVNARRRQPDLRSAIGRARVVRDRDRAARRYRSGDGTGARAPGHAARSSARPARRIVRPSSSTKRSAQNLPLSGLDGCDVRGTFGARGISTDESPAK
jgi:predicted permease